MYYSIQETISFITENLICDLSLEALAGQVHFSPYHFHRLFVQCTGKTPMEYIRRKRLASAVKDLLETNMNIADILSKYKFDSQDGFCRAFKKYYGITPGEFRNSYFRISYQEKEAVINMYTLEIFNKMKCTVKEKTELFETIDKIIELSRITRNNGLLSLEGQIDNVREVIFKKALQMLIDGAEADTIRELLLNYCLSGEYSNKEFLRRILIIEGSLLIQQGANPEIILETLSSYMGEDIADEINKHFNISEEAYVQLFENLSSNKPAKSKETSLLEGPFKKMDNRSMQRLLRDVDDYTLARALAGTSGDVQIKVFSNVSKKSAVMLSNELDLIRNTPVSDIAECQKRVLKIMDKLAIDGEINM